jgi:hypothetical protein
MFPASCGETAADVGGLMLAITSDGPLPVERLDLTVESGGKILRDAQYRVPEEATLPTTVAIASNGDATAAVNIAVVGWNLGADRVDPSDDVPLDRRDAIVTQVPTDRVALLTVVLSGRCSDKVTVEDGEAVSTCGKGNTCDPRTGGCESAIVNASELPEYQSGDEENAGLGGAPPAVGVGGQSGSPDDVPGGRMSVDAGAGGLGMGTGGELGAGGEPMGLGGEPGAGGTAGSSGGMGGSSAGSGGGGGSAGDNCSLSQKSCDGVPENGCETDTNTSLLHCGGCDAPCDPKHVVGLACEFGTCRYDTCQNGWCQGGNGCEAALGTDTNCTACGDVCPAQTPFCVANSCANARDIQVVGTPAHVLLSWTAQQVPRAELQHSLQTSRLESGPNRIVLLGVASGGTLGEPIAVSYGGQNATRIAAATGAQSWAGIYSVLDASLPSNAGTYVVGVDFAATPQAGFGGVTVLEAKYARQEPPAATNGTQGGACGASATRNLLLDVVHPGSLAYGVLSAASGTNAIQLGGVDIIETWNENSGSQASAGYLVDDIDRSFSWAVSDCSSTALAGVVIRRQSVP